MLPLLSPLLVSPAIQQYIEFSRVKRAFRLVFWLFQRVVLHVYQNLIQEQSGNCIGQTLCSVKLLRVLQVRRLNTQHFPNRQDVSNVSCQIKMLTKQFSEKVICSICDFEKGFGWFYFSYLRILEERKKKKKAKLHGNLYCSTLWDNLLLTCHVQIEKLDRQSDLILKCGFLRYACSISKVTDKPITLFLKKPASYYLTQRQHTQNGL